MLPSDEHGPVEVPMARGGVATAGPDEEVTVAPEGPSGRRDTLDKLEFTPTASRPIRLEKYRPENIVLLLTHLVVIILYTVSLFTPSFHIQTPTASIRMWSRKMTTCVNGNCSTYRLLDALCHELWRQAEGIMGLVITIIIAEVVGLLLAVLLVCGCAVCSKYAGIVVAIFSLTVGLFVVGLQGGLYNGTMCHSTSLRSLGMKYGPSFALQLTSFLLLGASVAFYIAWRCVKPPQYAYQ